MNESMKRADGAARAMVVVGLIGAAWSLGSLGGCVDRRIAITSEPAGALVHLNDQEVGRTPLEVNFEWFGTYDVRLALDGYEPLTASREAKAPLHEQPGLDLVALALPMTKRTRIAWHFDLEPAQLDQASLIERGLELGQRLGSGDRAETAAP